MLEPFDNKDYSTLGIQDKVIKESIWLIFAFLRNKGALLST